MKTQQPTQRFSPSVSPQLQTPPTTMTEYLTIIRNFILQMHQRVNEQFDYEMFPPNLAAIIDKAAVKLKSNKQQLSILEKENKNLESNKQHVTELNAEKNHLEKRFTQKNDEISILRQTVKTLYGDNEKLNQQKAKLNKQLSTSKQSLTQMKKKLKRQQEQMTKHKVELQKLTKIAEQRLTEYANEDKEKQKSIKKLNSQLERTKNEMEKVSKMLDETKRANEELFKAKSENESNLKVIDSLRYEMDNLKRENNALVAQLQSREVKFTEQINSLKNQLSLQTQKTFNLSISLKQFELNKQSMLTKLRSYEEDIMIRTQKMKEKNDQIQKYDQEVTKLIERIESLSEISSEVIKENEILTQKCQLLEAKLEQGRLAQQYVQRIKGELNYSKSMELGKLIEGLGNIKGKI